VSCSTIGSLVLIKWNIIQTVHESNPERSHKPPEANSKTNKWTHKRTAQSLKNIIDANQNMRYEEMSKAKPEEYVKRIRYGAGLQGGHPDHWGLSLT